MCNFSVEPTELLDFLYIGNDYNSKDVPLLRELGITHVINAVDGTIGGSPIRLQLYEGHMKYLNFLAQDRRFYNIFRHLETVQDFIDDARQSGGRVFIHCTLGVNRSGALAAAYIMLHTGRGPIAVVEEMKRKRGCVLTNPGFQEQLIHLANQRGLLLQDWHYVEAAQVRKRRAQLHLKEKIKQKKDKRVQDLFLVLLGYKTS